MAQSARFSVTPVRTPPFDVRDGLLQLSSTHLTQCLEDLRLTERIEYGLRATGYRELRAIEVSVDDRVVRLVGRVRTYYMKQVALATALETPGTHRIYNDLNVLPQS